MTSRVKFNAKPGKQFVIRREAFRLIKEAPQKKGIQLAHRKVIVDFSPELAEKMEGGNDTTAGAGADLPAAMTPEQKKELITAGAAAALNTIVAPEEDGPDGRKKNQ